MTRRINLIILIVALIGGVFAFVQQHRTKMLADEFEQLTNVFGPLDVTDESKFHIASVDSKSNKFFRWRAFYPAGVGLTTECDSPNGSSRSGTNTNTASTTEIVTCAFRFEPKKVNVYIGSSDSGSSLMSIGTGLVTPFLQEHWDELEFKFLAQDGMVVLDDSELLTFLEITIPELLAVQMVEELGPMSKRYRNRVFRFRRGTQAALVKQP